MRQRRQLRFHRNRDALSPPPVHICDDDERQRDGDRASRLYIVCAPAIATLTLWQRIEHKIGTDLQA